MELDGGVYPHSVVLRALHSLAPRIVGHVMVSGARGVTVDLQPIGSEAISDDECRQRLFIALGDFVLRERLEAETRSVRELIVAQAFTRSNLQLPSLDTSHPAEDPLEIGQPDAATGRRHQ